MFKNIIFLSVTVLLTSMMSFAGGVDSVGGNVLGSTDNMSLPDYRPGTNVNLTPGHAGAVGQVDWRAFSPAQGARVNFGFSGLSATTIQRVLQGSKVQNSNVDFGFEGVQQNMIQRIDGSKTDEITGKITPASGTLNVTTTPEDVIGKSQMNNIDFSGLKQTPIQRIEGGKTQDILNKITPAAGEYAYATGQNGNIVIETWNVSR